MAEVLFVYTASRLGFIILSAICLTFFGVQIWWDRKTLVRMFETRRMNRLQVHRSSRVCGALLALIMVIYCVDHQGTFGFYPLHFRIALRVLSFCMLVPPTLVWVYFTAKPLCPFLFADEHGALYRLRTVLKIMAILGCIEYAVFRFVSNPIVIIAIMIQYDIFFFVVWGLNVATYIRIRNMTKRGGNSFGGDSLQKVLRKWSRQAIAQSLILLLPFGVFAQVLLDTITKLNKPIAQETRAPPDELTSFAVLGFATSTLFVLFMYLMLYTSWRSQEFLASEFEKGSSPLKLSDAKSLTSMSSRGSSGAATTCGKSNLDFADGRSECDDKSVNATRTKSISAYEPDGSRPGSRKASVQVTDFAKPAPQGGRRSTFRLEIASTHV